MEDTAEYTTERSSRTEIQRYVVMLHLVREKMSTYKELANLLDINTGPHLSKNILGGIFQKIGQLEEEWSENIPEYIPRINLLVFKDPVSPPKQKGIASEFVCEYFTGDENTQPALKQIAELSAAVANYDKWDKVLDAFKPKLK